MAWGVKSPRCAASEAARVRLQSERGASERLTEDGRSHAYHLPPVVKEQEINYDINWHNRILLLTLINIKQLHALSV